MNTNLAGAHALSVPRRIPAAEEAVFAAWSGMPCEDVRRARVVTMRFRQEG